MYQWLLCNIGSVGNLYIVSERVYVRIGYIITYYMSNRYICYKFIDIVFIMSGRFLLSSTI